MKKYHKNIPAGMIVSRNGEFVYGSINRLHAIYNSLEDFVNYCSIYNCHIALGYKTPESAWANNPLVQTSTNPQDMCKVYENGRRYWIN